MQQHAQVNGPLLSRADVAAWLGVSVTTVVRLITRGEIDAQRIGERAVRVPKTSVEAYLARRGGAQ
jgi:excisionase family DNA binding protein